MKNMETNETKKYQEKYSYLVAGAKTNREMTDNLRRALSHDFPGIKFSVRFEWSSYLKTVHVYYTDGPQENEVGKTAYLFEYDTSKSEPQIDYYEYNPTRFNDIFGGFEFVFVVRKMSDEVRNELQTEVLNDFPGLPLDKDITRDEFYFVYANGVDAEVLHKYGTFGYWVGVPALIKHLFDKRTYKAPGLIHEKYENSVLEVVDYSEKSIAVFGETKAIKDQLKSLYGRFNANLIRNGSKCPGWIFSKRHSEAVRALVESVNF